MDVRRTQIHPVFSGDDVSQPVAGTRHLSHFWVSGRATREEHLHRVQASCASRLHSRQHCVKILARNISNLSITSDLTREHMVECIPQVKPSQVSF